MLALTAEYATKQLPPPNGSNVKKLASYGSRMKSHGQPQLGCCK
jgi:hypothetical protein